MSLSSCEVLKFIVLNFKFSFAERTEEEVTRTAQFARELVEILKSKPQYRIPFKDFIPAYHRQYGRQCRLIRFGFNKLSDLFESLPQVVQVSRE